MGVVRIASMAVDRCSRGAPAGDVFMAEELRVERERSKLDLEQITNLLHGGEAGTRMSRRTGQCIELETPLLHKYNRY